MFRKEARSNVELYKARCKRSAFCTGSCIANIVSDPARLAKSWA